MNNDIIETSDITTVAASVQGRIGHRIVHLRRTTSTMDVSRSMIEAAGDVGALDGTVVVADEQSKGRGRFGRKWDSQLGEDILASVILCPRLSITGQLTTMGSLAAALTVDAFAATRSEIKWPNDVLVYGKKVCGVIAESSIVGDSFAGILGIGLNVNAVIQDDAPREYEAISIREASNTGLALDRAEALTVLLERLNELYDALDRGESIIPEWRTRLITLGAEVEVSMVADNGSGELVRGFAENVDDFGRLLIREANGALRAVSSGEVTLRSSVDER